MRGRSTEWVGSKPPTSINSKTLVSANTPKCPTDASNSGKRCVADLARRSSGETVVSEKKSVVRQKRSSSPVDACISAPEAGVRRSAWAEVTQLRQAAQSRTTSIRFSFQEREPSKRRFHPRNEEADAALLTKITGAGGILGESSQCSNL